jgi:hypothetical protein
MIGKVSTDMIKQLSSATAAGISDCKKALEMPMAIKQGCDVLLRKRLATALNALTAMPLMECSRVLSSQGRIRHGWKLTAKPILWGSFEKIPLFRP